MNLRAGALDAAIELMYFAYRGFVGEEIGRAHV